MAISNYTFNRIYLDLKNRLQGAKISKIIKISNNDFSFFLYANKQEELIFSFDGANPIFFISSSFFKIVNESNNFTASLKKYFEGGTILSFTKIPEDKIFIFEIKKMTPTYQMITNKLIVELIPYRPNAIIVDENNVIIDALKKSSSLDDSHLIMKNVHYSFNPVVMNNYSIDDTLESLKNKTTKTVYNEIQYRVNNGQSIKDIILEIQNEKNYYAYKQDITSLKLTSFPDSKKITIDQISSLYEEKEQEKFKKDHYSTLIHLVEHKLKGLRKKLLNLEQDLKKAYSKEDYVNIGNLLFMGQDEYQKGMSEILIEGISIKLDPKLDLIENANKYFKEYQKSKKAIEQVKIQEELTKEKITYFEDINVQIKFANPDDMLQILDELKKDGYIKKEKNQNNKKNKVKEYKPHYYNFDSNHKIGYGLSSFQNDYLTFTLSNKDDYFLHVKDHSGPHVMVFNNNPSDEALLFASELSLYFAGLNEGEVYLARRKDVKKIPSKIGKVIINNYKVITINSIREESIKIFKELSKK